MSLQKYVAERLKITSNTKALERPKPTSRDELKSIIEDELKRQGPDADLNFIDVSEITDMRFIFYDKKIANIKIDEWDVLNVTDMSWMFSSSKNFNCNLSEWDVSKVTNMTEMFYGCINFDSDLSKWDVSSVIKMDGMFERCIHFNSDLSGWNVSKVTSYDEIFADCGIELNPELQPKFINDSLITERLKITSKSKPLQKVQPATKAELAVLIKEEVNKQGPDADLNFIDTSLITDMSYLFSVGGFSIGSIKIDEWDVSNVKICPTCSYHVENSIVICLDGTLGT